MNTILKKKRVESSQTVIGTKDILYWGCWEKWREAPSLLIVLRVFKKNIERFIRNLTPFYDKCKSWLKNLTPPPLTHTYSLRWCRTPSTFENWWKVTAIYPMIFLLFSHNYSKYRTLWGKWITSVRAWIFKCSRKFYAYNCFDL